LFRAEVREPKDQGLPVAWFRPLPRIAKAAVLADLSADQKETMKLNLRKRAEEGKIGWIFLWLLGVPIPILLILFLMRGCT
jgi:hypothetical protein